MVKLKNNETFRNLKKSWSYVGKNKKARIIFLLLSLLLSAFGAIAPILTAQSLLKISSNLLGQLMYLALIILALEVAKRVVSYFSQKVSQKLFGQILLSIQGDVAKTLLKLETKKLDSTSSGVFIDRMTKDTGDIAGIFPSLGDSLINIITNI